MLGELYIRNLAVIEEVRIALEPGLTVISGEEGAGKSVLVDALSLLLGGRANTTLVRMGTSAALVEGIFWVSTEDSGVSTVLHKAGLELEDDGSIILAREVQAQGRSIARVNGRAVPISLIRELGQKLIDIHSQMDHLSLLSPQYQMDLLDSYGGLLETRCHMGERVAALRAKSRELETFAAESAHHQRDLLEHNVAEIVAANVHPDEEEALKQEYKVLQHAQAIKAGCYAAYSLMYDDDRSAASLVHQAHGALRGIAAIDPDLRLHLEAIDSCVAELEEAAQELRRYADKIESSSSRLEQIEGRLELLRHLKHKYGPTLRDVVDFAARASAELESLQAKEERRCYLEEELQELKREVGALGEELSTARQKAAQSLAGLANGELADLGMTWARFDIRVSQDEHHEGLTTSRGTCSFGQCGIDQVEFLGVTNPGEPLRPLREIASGGETSRFMLALKSALQQADSVATLVFDEIDIGLGGRSAHTVGEKLKALSQGRQVICITHLPQIACFGQKHYQVSKDVSSGRAVTHVEQLEGDSRVKELAAMLGSYAEESMVESAQELLRRAAKKRAPSMAAVMAG